MGTPSTLSRSLPSTMPVQNLDKARTDDISECLCLPYSKTFVWIFLQCLTFRLLSQHHDHVWWMKQTEQRLPTKMILLFWGVFLAGSRRPKQWGESCVPSLAECLTLLYSASWLVCLSLFLTTLLGFPVCGDRTNIVTYKCIPII